MPSGAATPSRTGRLVASAAIAAGVTFALYYPDRDDGSGAVLGGLFAFAGAALGLAAVSDLRQLPPRSVADRLRLLAASLVMGFALGLLNLAANYAIASIDAGIREEMVRQWTTFSPWSIVFAGPLVEEIGFRLLLVGGAAWLLSRRIEDRRVVFLWALAVSAAAFGIAHAVPSSRPTTGLVHALGVVLKSTAAGVVLGWVFWRKGLPYSVVCHGTANAVHLVLWRLVF